MQNEKIFYATENFINLTDEQIISQIKQGNDDALAYLLEKYKDIDRKSVV